MEQFFAQHVREAAQSTRDMMKADIVRLLFDTMDESFTLGAAFLDPVQKATPPGLYTSIVSGNAFMMAAYPYLTGGLSLLLSLINLVGYDSVTLGLFASVRAICAYTIDI